MSPDRTTWSRRLRRLSPQAFERLVAAIWEAHGWRCGISSPGPDGGVDVTARRSGLVDLTIAVQVKQYAPDRSIGVRTVREYAGLYRGADPPDKVCLVASCGYTATARMEARERGVRLVDGHDLVTYCDAVENRINCSLEVLVTYLDNCPRTDSVRLSSIRQEPPAIPGATAVDETSEWSRPKNGGTIRPVLSHAEPQEMVAQDQGLFFRIVPSLGAPNWRPSVLFWSPPEMIQCRNISPQACQNLRSFADRHPRARYLVDGDTHTLYVTGGVDGDIDLFPRAILVACIGISHRDLISVIRYGEQERSVVYVPDTGEGLQ